MIDHVEIDGDPHSDETVDADVNTEDIHIVYDDENERACHKQRSEVCKKYRNKGTMYGMLLESVQHFIKQEHGQYIWQSILEHAGVKNIVFTTHKVYSDDVMVNLARGCSSVLGDKTVDEYMNYFGKCFVEFFSHYGYDKILRISGRHYRDFLNGIDNLHEMMRFSYPHLQSPSFYVESEDQDGCVLVYKSKRRGFKQYVIGQLKQCASVFYNVHVDITTLTEYEQDEGYCIKYRLDFDNDAFIDISDKTSTSITSHEFPDISANTFFKIFPFSILFDRDFIIRHTGSKLPMLLDNDSLLGSYMPSKFILRRPLVEFNWQNVELLQSVMFELQYVQKVRTSSFMRSYIGGSLLDRIQNPQEEEKELSFGHSVLFRGQMKLMPDWNVMAFLCAPLVGNLDDMRDINLYINDLNMYDNSRDMVMAGWQHASRLECSIEQQIKKGQKITEIMKTLDEWQTRSNNLLYAMIPESIAERLKKGDDPINTCETFDEVTILFSYLVGFTDICAQATPMQIVKCITDVVKSFDSIVDKYDCFKVETLGDAVYMVAGGVPDRRPNHAGRVAGLALELVKKSQSLKDPVSNKNLQLRIGMHTGSVVGGVVGRRMPQYCLFGDTVNTASRMQSYSEPGRIHLSESCYKCLVGRGFVTVFRGKVNVKGKGEMKTYWLCGKEGHSGTGEISKQYKVERLLRSKHKIYRSFENGFDFHGIHATTSSANFSTHFDFGEDCCQTGQRDTGKLNRTQSLVALSTLPCGDMWSQFKTRKISDSVTERTKQNIPVSSESDNCFTNIHPFYISEGPADDETKHESIHRKPIPNNGDFSFEMKENKLVCPFSGSAGFSSFSKGGSGEHFAPFCANEGNTVNNAASVDSESKGKNSIVNKHDVKIDHCQNEEIINERDNNCSKENVIKKSKMSTVQNTQEDVGNPSCCFCQKHSNIFEGKCLCLIENENRNAKKSSQTFSSERRSDQHLDDNSEEEQINEKLVCESVHETGIASDKSSSSVSVSRPGENQLDRCVDGQDFRESEKLKVNKNCCRDSTESDIGTVLEKQVENRLNLFNGCRPTKSCPHTEDIRRIYPASATSTLQLQSGPEGCRVYVCNVGQHQNFTEPLIKHNADEQRCKKLQKLSSCLQKVIKVERLDGSRTVHSTTNCLENGTSSGDKRIPKQETCL